MTRILFAGMAAALVALAAALWRSRRRLGRMVARVEKSARDLERMQLAFSRFAPLTVVEEVIARGTEMRAEARDVTVLFADLKGFTAMSERLDPDELVEILNGYFHSMSEAITQHRGHVSKFMGDGLMALFGAPEPNPWQATDAVAAALDMRSALAAYNERLSAEGRERLDFGIGIHSGRVVAGLIGSDALLEFTVIGDTVNVASRVEGLTRRHGVDILVTESVRKELPAQYQVRRLDPMEVKGKSMPISTYAVEGVGAVSGAGTTTPSAPLRRRS